MTMNRTISNLSLLLPIGLYIAAAVMGSGSASGDYGLFALLRDGFLFGAIILSFPLVNRQAWASDRNFLQTFRHLFVFVLVYYLLSSLLHILFDPMESTDQPWLVFGTGFISTLYVIIALGMLRNLIFVKQRPSTFRNFALLLQFLLIFSLLGLGESLATVFPALAWLDNQILNSIILFLLIYLMVINAFRMGWVNYLNKKQKLACFWSSLLLLPLQVHITIRLFDLDHANISPFLSTFIPMASLFITIYLGVTLLALIAHLPTAQLFDRKIRQIESLFSISRAVSTEFELNKLVVLIVKLAAEVTESDFIWLELADHESGNPHLVSSRNLTRQEKEARENNYHRHLWNLIKQTREAVVANQLSLHSVAKEVLHWKQDIGSLIGVPLVSGKSMLGILYAGKSHEFSFEQEDVDMLRAFGEQVVVAIENARLIKASLEKERLEQELRIAHDAQMKLLPKRTPVIPNIQLAADCRTANEVGGDYYDFFPLEHGCCGVVVGDVSGKGPSAAFYMAEIKGIMGALAKDQRSPRDVLNAANRIVYNTIEDNQFITLVYGIIDPNESCFTFCRAGHCPVLVTQLDSNVVKLQEPPGMGLGLDSGHHFEHVIKEERIDLKPGHTLLLYTDGVVETRNAKGQEYGEKQLAKDFGDLAPFSADEIKSKLIQRVQAFAGSQKPHDDMTFVVIKVEK